MIDTMKIIEEILLGIIDASINNKSVIINTARASGKTYAINEFLTNYSANSFNIFCNKLQKDLPKNYFNINIINVNLPLEENLHFNILKHINNTIKNPNNTLPENLIYKYKIPTSERVIWLDGTEYTNLTRLVNRELAKFRGLDIKAKNINIIFDDTFSLDNLLPKLILINEMKIGLASYFKVPVNIIIVGTMYAKNNTYIDLLEEFGFERV
jgi:hypothetical protein